MKYLFTHATYSHHTSSSDPTYRFKRLRHLAWQMFPCSYVVGLADADELTLCDGWQSTVFGDFTLCTIRSSVPIDAWTWLDNEAVMGGGPGAARERRDRVALLAGNKVSIHDHVLTGAYERASAVDKFSPLLDGAAAKWKQVVPLSGGDDVSAFVAVLTEPCLQAQIRSRFEEGRGLNETLQTLRSVQGQRKKDMKRKGREEDGDVAMEEEGEAVATQAGSSSSSSDAVVDLRGRIGGVESGGAAAPSSLFDTLMGGITRQAAPALLLPTPPTTQSDDDGGSKLLFLRVPVVPSKEPEGKQEILRFISLDKRVLAMPALLASSRTYIAIGDPWSSTILVLRLSDDFPAVTATEELYFELPIGLVPRGLRVFGDHTLVCLAVEAAGAKGGGGGGGGGGGASTAQSNITATLIEFSLKEEEAPEESEGLSTVATGGASADPSQEEEQQQQQEPANIMAFLRSFRDEVRTRFDKLEGRMETLERRLSDL